MAGLCRDGDAGVSARQQTIAAAEEWLREQCPDTSPEDRHNAAVRIANIVLYLWIKSDTEPATASD